MKYIAVFLLLSLLPLSAQDHSVISSGSIVSGTLPTTASGSDSAATAPSTSSAENTSDNTSPAVEDNTEESAPAVALAPPPSVTDPATSTGQEDARPANEQQPSFLQRPNLILAKLLDSTRAMDPFGMPMDPSSIQATSSLAEQYHEEDTSTQLDNSAFKTALLSLPITGVYTDKKILVLGARSFPVGGQFGMKVQDMTIRLRFEGIRKGELFFKDMETKEIASIPFQTLPAEFEPLRKGEPNEIASGIQRMSGLYIAN